MELKQNILLRPTQINQIDDVVIYSWNDAKVQIKIGDIITANLLVYKDDFKIGKIVDGDQQCVQVEYDYGSIEISLVHIKEKSGICTSAVSRTMLALILYVQSKDLPILRGEVDIKSKRPCAAFVCYSQAFLANGFFVDQYMDTTTTIRKDIQKMYRQIKKLPPLVLFNVVYTYTGALKLRF